MKQAPSSAPAGPPEVPASTKSMPFGFEPRMTADRVAPIGVAAVGNDVAGLEDICELRQHGVDRRTGGHIKHDEARRRKQRGKVLKIRGDLQAGARQIDGYGVGVCSSNVKIFSEGILGQAGAHLAEADDAERADRC